jgi:hypothetical protein
LTLEPLESKALLTVTVNQMFVAEDYVLFLNRLPAQSELNGWVAQLDKGVNPLVVGSKIANSLEAYTDDVTNDYEAYLGRQPAPSEVNLWVKYLNSGKTTDQLKASILGSQEFFNDAGGTNQGFLQTVYTDVLGREIDPSGAASWGAALARGVSRTTVALDIATSQEQATNEVTRNYEVILGRPPDPAGLANWTSLRDALPKLTSQQVVNYFVTSQENIGRITTAIANGTVQSYQDVFVLLNTGAESAARHRH